MNLILGSAISLLLTTPSWALCSRNSLSSVRKSHLKQAFFHNTIGLTASSSFPRLSFQSSRNNQQMSQLSSVSSDEVQAAFEKIDLSSPMDASAVTLINNARYVTKKKNDAAKKNGRDVNAVQLVCVSKTKPAENIQTLYDAGFRVFGENYFQELLEKAATLPQDIKWHFIGNLQSAKASKLVRAVPNLSVVETVDTIKLAKKLNTACEAAGRSLLSIYIQVDTSGEETKSGVDPADVISFVQSIKAECPLLEVAGLMTIGAPDDYTCFDKLVKSRADLAATLGVDPLSLALSMGMSGDYEEAILRGATNVRVGSTIFGARDYGTPNPNPNNIYNSNYIGV
jgi:PLP dependent protein